MLSTEILSELIRRKHNVLTQLREVGRRQMDLVESGDTASLLTLLAAKQKLIAALQAVERELKPYYAEDPERRLWASPQHRADCAARVIECNALLEEIVRLEKSSAERMADRRNEVAQQLEQVHAAGQVRSAYQAHRRSPQ